MFPRKNLKRFFYKAIRQPVYASRVFFKRIQAAFYYLFGNGRSSYPEAVTLFLTHRCNLHCKMCGQWGEGGVTSKQGSKYINAEFTPNELKAVVDDMASFKPNITLFGGEPLLHCDAIEIIKYIKQKGMHCLVITNGFLLEGLAEKIVDSGLDELNVSLDGRARLHDQIRGFPGLFDKIMVGLKRVQYFKSQKKKHRPLINLQCTVTKYNCEYLEQLLEVAEEAKADSLTFHHLIFVDRESIERQKAYDILLGCSSSDWEGFAFEPGIDPEALYTKIQEIISVRRRFNVDFYPNLSRKAMIEYYQDHRYMPSEYHCRCLSPWIAAYIFPDGEVRPCLNASYSFGNIKNMGFSEIWNNEKAVNFRKILKENKTFPLCARCTELYRY
jgi:MoaA/NifB/PqqE/SkfB family radical SAM enzyme